jgi:hypothetical protein
MPTTFHTIEGPNGHGGPYGSGNPDEMANADINQAITTLGPAPTKPQLVKATARHMRSVQRQSERIRK